MNKWLYTLAIIMSLNIIPLYAQEDTNFLNRQYHALSRDAQLMYRCYLKRSDCSKKDQQEAWQATKRVGIKGLVLVGLVIAVGGMSKLPIFHQRKYPRGLITQQEYESLKEKVFNNFRVIAHDVIITKEGEWININIYILRPSTEQDINTVNKAIIPFIKRNLTTAAQGYVRLIHAPSDQKKSIWY